jgi:hypothetical protein
MALVCSPYRGTVYSTFFVFENLYRGGRTPSLQTFSKVSVLIHLLYEIIIRRTFQNLCLGLKGAQLRSTGLQVAVYLFFRTFLFLFFNFYLEAPGPPSSCLKKTFLAQVSKETHDTGETDLQLLDYLSADRDQ